MQVILLTDADVDGAHIRTLLLTFLYRWQRELFTRGSIYVGMPPLYKVEAGRKSRYCYDDSERDVAIAEFGGKPHIQRFKVDTQSPLTLFVAPSLGPSCLIICDLMLSSGIR